LAAVCHSGRTVVERGDVAEVVSASRVGRAVLERRVHLLPCLRSGLLEHLALCAQLSSHARRRPPGSRVLATALGQESKPSLARAARRIAIDRSKKRSLSRGNRRRVSASSVISQASASAGCTSSPERSDSAYS